MSRERFIPVLPVIRQVDAKDVLQDVKTPALVLPGATDDQARALDEIFAKENKEQNTLVDAIQLAAAGMLLHDIVKDTFSSEEEEDEEPAAKPKATEPEPEPGGDLGQ
jgi:hypothetical protein